MILYWVTAIAACALTALLFYASETAPAPKARAMYRSAFLFTVLLLVYRVAA